MRLRGGDFEFHVQWRDRAPDNFHRLYSRSQFPAP